MSLNLTTLNARGLRDPSKCAWLLSELSNLWWMLLQCKRLTSFAQRTVGCWGTTLKSFSVFGSRCSTGISLLVERSLNVIVNLVFAGDEGRLVIVDVAVKSFEFRVVAVYASNGVGERRSFFWQLEPFFDDPKRKILMGDWNTILDPTVDKAGWGASGSDERESSLIDLMAQHNLVDWFHRLYVLALKPLLRRLRDGMVNPALRGVLFAGRIRAKVSTYADIAVFVSRRSDIKAMEKVIKSYEEVEDAKINFDKSKGLRLGAWRDGVPLPRPFRWSDGPVCILVVWIRPSLQLEQNWLEVRTKVEVLVGTGLRRRLSLNLPLDPFPVIRTSLA